MKSIKRILKGIGTLIGVFLLYVIIVIAHGTITDFQGDASVSLDPLNDQPGAPLSDSTFSVLIWNIGYAGLGKETAFFFDQGKMLHAGDTPTRTPKEFVEKNALGTKELIKEVDTDFFLLQEVDVHSKRSYYINAYEEIASVLPEHSAYFGVNYKVKRVPIPILQPFSVYGQVNSGLATYSKYAVKSAERFQLPGSFDWPNNIFQLDRCMLVQRIDAFDKELVLINVHNSAYDKGGVMKAQQMEFIQSFCKKEYAKGNYVLLGGDWNQCPPDFAFDQLASSNPFGYSQINIEEDFLPEGWKWCYDSTIPSNRKNRTAYIAGESFVTVIDFYLASPNIELLEVQTIDTEFDFSDHQPVKASFRLR